MARRCGNNGCSYPRANWWKAALGVDWLSSGSSAPDLPGWTYRQEIELNNEGNPEALSSQQVLISLTSSNFNFANAQSSGQDIRFTDSSGNVLNHWISSYSSGGQTASIYVKVTSVNALATGRIYLFSGNAGASTTSSFANTMLRFQTTETNMTSVVRFGDGSGTTAANLGSDGALSLQGGYTWNSSDLYGGTTGSLSLNGSTGYIEKSGLLDTMPAEGHIKFTFSIQSFRAGGNNFLFSKVWRTGNGVTDFGDFIDCWISNGHVLNMACFKGATQPGIQTGATILQLNTKYEVSVVWNNQLVILYLNGRRELFSSAFVLSNGTAAPFRIGVRTDLTTGAAGSGTFGANTHANITINDFCLQSYQPHYAYIKALHDNVKYFGKNQISKWNVSKTWDSSVPPTDPTYKLGEASLFYEGGVFYMYYGKLTIATGRTDTYRKQTTALTPNVTPTWTNDVKVVGNSTGGESSDVYRSLVRKFGSTYYLYYTTAASGGDISCVTSSDGVTFSNKVTVMPIHASFPLGWNNADVVYDSSDGLYKMMVEASMGSGSFVMCLATCATPDGTFTLSGTNPKSSLQYPASFGTPPPNVGGATMNWIGSQIHMWYHCNRDLGGGSYNYSETFHAYSTDFNTWTKDTGSEAVFFRERASPNYDQTSDPTVIEANGACYAIFHDNDNRGSILTSLIIAKFNGTLAQLVSDFSVTVNAVA